MSEKRKEGGDSETRSELAAVGEPWHKAGAGYTRLPENETVIGTLHSTRTAGGRCMCMHTLHIVYHVQPLQYM